MTSGLRLWADALSQTATEKFGNLRGQFLTRALLLKFADERHNPWGYSFFKESQLSSAAAVAMMMSGQETEGQDALFPEITWGKGKWPSVQFASYLVAGTIIYGMGFPLTVDLESPYGSAFQYADKTLNGGTYTGSTGTESDPEALNNYIKAVSEGATPLDFVLYVPKGYGNMAGTNVPNVEETTDPARVLTASFAGGRETW